MVNDSPALKKLYNKKLSTLSLDAIPYFCAIVDKDLAVIDCNEKAIDFCRMKSKQDCLNNLLGYINSMLPVYQPDGNRSRSIEEAFPVAKKNGVFDFDCWFNYDDKLHPVHGVIVYLNCPDNWEYYAFYLYDLTSQMHISHELEIRDSLLNAVNEIAHIMVSSKMENFEESLWTSLGILGSAADVDRVYIWHIYEGEDGVTLTDQLYEWSPYAEAQQGNEYTVGIVFEDAVTWSGPFRKNRSVKGIVKNMTEAEIKQLAPQGIVSILVTPIFIENKLWGFIGFDDCHNEREFTEAEEGILRTGGHLVISSIIRNKTMKDLVEAKEVAVSSARAKSNFLANMSHEIRTPMNAILGMTELILREDANDAIVENANTIKIACKNLLSIINDILDISKIESGKLDVINAEYQLSSLILDTISIIKMRADAKDLTFVVELDSKLPSRLYGDEVRIKQILINILGNAIKFTEQGSVKLNINSERLDGNIHMTFVISDTGIGIKPEEINRVFDSFTQVDTKKNRNIEGTGLGLPISRQLAVMMGGTVTVESQYGEGSTFTVTLVQKLVDPTPIVHVDNINKKRVLVYETRSLYLSSIKYALESLGCDYFICFNQSELYEQLNVFNYSHVFVASLHYEKTLSLIKRNDLDVTVVRIASQEEFSTTRNQQLLTMPIHIIQVASILNNESVIKNIGSEEDLLTLSAPTARVLVVDDNMINLMVAEGLLQAYDLRVDTSLSGADAVDKVKENEYDLIFMDHMMPDMDGIDTTLAIRNLGTDYSKKVPIVALTANAVSGVREMFKAEGLNDYLPKPIELSQLHHILTEWLPEEKQIHKNIVETEKEEQSLDLEIGGLNVNEGLRFANGSMDSYNEILRTYAKDGENKLIELSDSYRDGDLRLFTTYIHALKSASASIGDAELSKLAEELENAGNNHDLTYIDIHLTEFRARLIEVIANISAYLIALDNGAETDINSLPEGTPELLSNALFRIKNHLQAVELEQAEGLLNELAGYRWSENTSADLKEIKDTLRIFDYDEAERLVAALLLG